MHYKHDGTFITILQTKISRFELVSFKRESTDSERVDIQAKYNILGWVSIDQNGAIPCQEKPIFPWNSDNLNKAVLQQTTTDFGSNSSLFYLRISRVTDKLYWHASVVNNKV